MGFGILLFLPAFVMLFYIIMKPFDGFSIESRNWSDIQVVWIALQVVLIVVFPVIAIPLLVGVGGILIQRSLLDTPPKIGVLSFGLILIGFPAILFGIMASEGDWGGIFAVLLSFSSACVALVSGIWIGITLPKFRKIVGILFGLVLPFTFYQSVEVGDARSPERKTEENGNQIIAVLHEYHKDTGHYPKTLDLLTPEYFLTLPEALTTQGTGWLYSLDGEEFHLGFWDYPGKYQITLCIASSLRPDWQCDVTDVNDWGVFKPVPTPTSTPFATYLPQK